INVSSVKPIKSTILIEEISRTKGVLVLEEHNKYCGFGSILARIICEHHPIPMRFIGIEDTFGQSGNREALLNFYGLNKRKVIKNVKSLLMS
ncbi:MAG: transketolase C-terminal domain-containing protein, partial [Candidatus Heimdallarchaeota archaeon]